MGKKFSYILALCLCTSIFFTACNNKIMQESKEKIKQEESKKSENYKKTDEDMIKFSKKYLDIYDQEGNAFIELTFKNKDFLPKELWDKVKIFYAEDNYDLNKADGYKLFINCNDNTLYKIDCLEYDETREYSMYDFYMSKGDFFVVKINQDLQKNLIVRAYDDTDLFSERHIYIDTYDELLKKGHILQDVSFWKKEPKVGLLFKEKSDFIENNAIYRKIGNIDLDGDGKNERIYFWGETDYIADEPEYFKVKSRFRIGKFEYNLEDLSKDNIIEGEKEYYLPYFNTIEIIDIDKNDKYKEIVFKKLNYGIPTFLGKVYHYEDGVLKYVGSINYAFDEELISGIDDNKLTITNIHGNIGFNFTYDEVYEIKDENIILKEEPTVKMNAFSNRVISFLNKKLNLYEKIDSKEPIITLEPEDQLIFLETDKATWIKVKSFKTGKTGYIKFDYNNEEGKVSIYNQSELKDVYFTDIFSRLTM